MRRLREGSAQRDPQGEAVSDDEELFSSRPERIEKCARCGGRGEYVNHYALRHNDNSHADRMAVHRRAGLVIASVRGASDIFESCNEAAEIAARAGRAVAFWFNGRAVVVRPGDVGDAVARAWWVDVHGETPEETYARR